MLSVMFRWLWVCSTHRLSSSTNNLNNGWWSKDSGSNQYQPKIVGGRLFLNATSGTHIYFDKETTAGENYSTGWLPNTPGFHQQLNCQRATSRRLISSAPWRSLVSSLDNGWCYVSYSNHIKKLQHTVWAFTCLHCTNTNAVGVLRVMTKLNNTRAYEADHVLAGMVWTRRTLRHLHLLQAWSVGDLDVPGQGRCIQLHCKPSNLYDLPHP